MEKNREIEISKALSYWLRHHPEDIGISLDSSGWTDVRDLLDKSRVKILFDFNELKKVVQNNDKKRFELSDDFCRIRASQGHSVDVDIEFEEVIPPRFLYHGTPRKNVESIIKSGVNRGNRTYVHLSPDIETATAVGSRRGEFEILKVEAMRMRADGIKIYVSKNGVYLTDYVPTKYISKL